MLRGTLPRYGSSYLPRVFVPMLAKSFDKAALKGSKVADGPYFASPKIDGVRCVITKDGAFSRRRFRLHGLDHILKDLKPAFNADPSLVLDGELYAARQMSTTGGFEKVLAIITQLRRKSNSKSAAAAANRLRFHVFDVIQMGQRGWNTGRPRILSTRWNTDEHIVTPNRTPFYVRDWALQALFKNYLSRASNVRRVHHCGAHTIADARLHLHAFLKQRYEGCVLRTFDNRYEPGKRSKTMLKMIPWHDKEFRILRIIKAKPKEAARSRAKKRRGDDPPSKRRVLKNGKRASASFFHRSAISAIECLTDTGVIFRAHVGVPNEVATKWLANASKIEGMYATVRFPSKTQRGVPRFAVVKGIRGNSASSFL